MELFIYMISSKQELFNIVSVEKLQAFTSKLHNANHKILNF
jgi:hypothetical protein